MALINIGGYRWSLQLVGFAPPGRGSSSEMPGYFPSGAKRGRPSGDQIKTWTVDVWSVNAVYSLFDGDDLLYIGEGVLGDRLLAHFREDEFAGRWNSFTWLSPSTLDVLKSPFEIKPHDANQSITKTEKELIEAFELLAIRLGDPWGNRQNPADDESIKWLKQLRSKHAPKSEGEKLDEILTLLRAK